MEWTGGGRREGERARGEDREQGMRLKMAPRALDSRLLTVDTQIQKPVL